MLSTIHLRRRESYLINTSKKKAVGAAEIALDKKAKDVIILELKGLSSITDYFVICSGGNPAQIRAIAEAIQEGFSKRKFSLFGKEGLDSARWVLLDYSDVVINIFHEDTRSYYDLEKLWMDAPRIPVERQKK